MAIRPPKNILAAHKQTRWTLPPIGYRFDQAKFSSLSFLRHSAVAGRPNNVPISHKNGQKKTNIHDEARSTRAIPEANEAMSDQENQRGFRETSRSRYPAQRTGIRTPYPRYNARTRYSTLPFGPLMEDSTTPSISQPLSSSAARTSSTVRRRTASSRTTPRSVSS